MNDDIPPEEYPYEVSPDSTESTDAKLARMIEKAKSVLVANPLLPPEDQVTWCSIKFTEYLSLLLLVQTMGKALEEARIDAKYIRNNDNYLQPDFKPEVHGDSIFAATSSALLARDEAIKELK